MTETIELHGQCLCGATKVRAGSGKKSIGACHCSMCRKWGGGPFITVECGSDVRFGGDENIGVFDSSEWAERGFCRRCGTHLFYRLKEGQLYFLPVGLFGDNVDFVFDHQVFIDEKPEYYSFSNHTKDLTGEELFALFAPKE